MRQRRFSGVLFSMLCLLAVCASEIQVQDSIRSWKEAREACRKQGNPGSCDLITETRLQEKWSDLGVTGDDSLWVGAQRFSRWFWHEGNNRKLGLFKDHGCYKLTGRGSGFKSLEVNGPYQCHKVCETSGFVYLKGNNCSCASALEGKMASLDQCPLLCDGSQDKCGGKNDHFSVYSIPSEIRFVDEETSQNCVVGRLRGNTLYVESTSCRGYHHYFCSSDKARIDVPARSEQYDIAVSRCQTRHDSTLLSLSYPEGAGQLVSDLETLRTKVTGLAPTTFWLPLQRQVKAVWVDGQEGEEGGESGYCLAATPRTASFRLTDFPCSEWHGAICECSSVINPDNGSNGGSDDGKTQGLSKTIIIVIVLVMILLPFISIMLFLRMRRMAAIRELSRMQNERFRWENPLFKGPPDTEKGPPETEKGPPETEKGPAETEKGPAETEKGPPETEKGPAETEKQADENL